ncbi:hypothetical protein [Perigonia lusca single nucleopolyhedrovirus]|uniref:Uncharacterized protein n=1 Tax=Perigonia lusca single nucleopolyhedrovirus TaxID=1675865 RepID=A0A0M3WR61_9ABAC|nr:hypothetical protein [Perigonia lusca single nucleopolyhedrovirus]AKN80685.1 hypothetical protein [Perigonia lusca single nucleopolyhedrovirus]
MLVLFPVNVYLDDCLVELDFFKYDFVSNKLIGTYVIDHNIKHSGCVKVHINSPPLIVRNGDKLPIDNLNNRKHIQATFQIGKKFLCVVNSKSCDPIVFDGFTSPHNEMKTEPLQISYLKSLKQDHGLCVRDMAKAMNQNTILRIFINEANFINNTTKIDKKNRFKWFRRQRNNNNSVSINNSTDTNNSFATTSYNSLNFNTTNENYLKNLDISDGVGGSDGDDSQLHERVLFDNINKTEGFENYVFYIDNNNDDDVKKPNNTKWVPVQCKTGPLLCTIDLVFVFK